MSFVGADLLGFLLVDRNSGAALSGDILAVSLGDLVAGLLGDLVAAFLGDSFADFPGNFVAVALWHLMTSLLSIRCGALVLIG